ncbi:hypothetical protein ACTFIZ_004361 [Dictyostelium cf. discoideum]
MIKDIKKIVNGLELKCMGKNCKSNGKNYCLDDNQILCEDCSKAHESYLNHDCISIDDYIESSLFVDYDFITKEIKDIDIDKYNIEMDEKNKLFYIESFKNGFNQEAIIEGGEKWSNIGISDKEPFLLVSFIGYTGSGKSSCVSQLCINDENGNFNHPIPAKNGSTTSTSSDINSFIGRVDSNDQNSLKYLILDSEGIGGTDIPECLKKFLQSINLYPNSFIESRNKLVQNCYPRFLYIISDVIVFTFKGDPKEKNHIYKTIIDFSLVTSNISYKKVKPQLIILLNKQSNPSDFDDKDNAKKDFFSTLTKGAEEELNKYYQSISVIYLPNANENQSFNRYKTQTNLLKEIIGEKVLESYAEKKKNHYDTSYSYGMNNIRLVVNYFNNDQNSNINLDKIQENEKIDSFETSCAKNKELIFEPSENTPIANEREKILTNCIDCGNLKIPFSCGHIFCLHCENKSVKCTKLPCEGRLKHRKEIDFNSKIGSRVLSLDGGGTRGIIQCCFLSILKSELFGIKIHNLFDLIVGTGTGGLISILISNEREPDDIMRTIEKLNTDFPIRYISKAGRMFGSSLTNTNNFHSFIDDVFKNETQFIETCSNTKVAVTSAALDLKKNLKDSLFLNFYKDFENDEKSYQINDTSCDVAAKASCSAPPFTDGYEFRKYVHYDGGVLGTNNNPCNISKKLIYQIWGQDKYNDIFVSIGAGEPKIKKNNFYSHPKNGDQIKLLKKNEESWKKLIKGYDNFKKIRVNVELDIHCQMFSNKPIIMDYMKEKAMDFSKNKDFVYLINKSISSLFYLSDLTFNQSTQTLEGNINFRLKSIPEEIKNQLCSPQNQFYLLNNKQLYEFEISMSDFTFSKILHFSISNPPEIIDIVCSINSKTRFKNETSISGCPFNIKKNLEKYNIKVIQ